MTCEAEHGAISNRKESTGGEVPVWQVVFGKQLVSGRSGLALASAVQLSAVQDDFFDHY